MLWTIVWGMLWTEAIIRRSSLSSQSSPNTHLNQLVCMLAVQVEPLRLDIGAVGTALRWT